MTAWIYAESQLWSRIAAWFAGIKSEFVLNFITKNRWRMLLNGLGTTLLITLVSCLIFNVKAHSFYKQLSVLFGLVVGYAAAYFYGMVDLSRISQVSIISVPSILPVPLEFHPDAIFSIFLTVMQME